MTAADDPDGIVEVVRFVSLPGHIENRKINNIGAATYQNRR